MHSIEHYFMSSSIQREKPLARPPAKLTRMPPSVNLQV